MTQPNDGRRPCASVIAAGAVSAFGVGRDAYRAADLGQPARVAVAADGALAAAGFVRPVAARAPSPLPVEASDDVVCFEDRAAALLACALDQTVRALDAARPGWRGERLGIAMGTSSGGMLTAERFFAAPPTLPR